MNVGDIANNVVSPLIAPVAVFMNVKAVNALRRQEAEAPPPLPEPTTTKKPLIEICDELQKA